MASLAGYKRNRPRKQLRRIDPVEFIAVIAELAMHLDGFPFIQD